MFKCLAVLLFCSVVSATIYFKDDFSDEGWRSRWVDSTKKGASQGKFEWSAGSYYADSSNGKGLMASEDMRFYTTTASFPEFSNKGKKLVIQYTARLPKKFDCGGAYIKLYASGIEGKNVDGDTSYNVMFGPDICGYQTSKIHAIFNHKGKNLEKKEEVKLGFSEKDEYTHLYTLVVNPDDTYEILFDQQSKAKGNLLDDWSFTQPKEIDDPKDVKPADWVDDAKIVDPEDKKPAGWDDIPKQIADPDAKKPSEWDDESDGEWEAPMIDNPAYKGEWKPKMIDNPAYKGQWSPRRIPNPDYVEEKNVYAFSSFGAVGIEDWQVNGGTIFDNIIITDSIEEANAFAEKTWKGVAEAEKKMKEEQDKANAPPAPKAEEKKEDDDEDDDEDEDDKDKKDEL